MIVVSYLEEEAKADPLVVLVVPPLFGVYGLVYPRVGYIESYALPKGTRDSVGGVYPTIGIEDVLRNVFGMDAVDGVAHVLLGRHDEGEGEHDGRRHTVVEAEHPRVYVHVGDTQQPAKLAKDVQHLVFALVDLLRYTWQPFKPSQIQIGFYFKS